MCSLLFTCGSKLRKPSCPSSVFPQFRDWTHSSRTLSSLWLKACSKSFFASSPSGPPRSSLSPSPSSSASDFKRSSKGSPPVMARCCSVACGGLKRLALGFGLICFAMMCSGMSARVCFATPVALSKSSIAPRSLESTLTHMSPHISSSSSLKFLPNQSDWSMMRAFVDVLAASSVERSFVSELSVFKAVKVCRAYTALSEDMSVSFLISALGI